MKNEDLLLTICDNLNKAGLKWTDSNDIMSVKKSEFDLGTKFIRQLQYLPKQNLEKIVAYGCKEYKTFDELYRAWGWEGFFRFKPYLIEDNENCSVSMVLGHNRFLHMFHGYYFQISSTPNGNGALSVSPYETTGLFMHPSAYVEGWQCSKLFFMCLYTNLIDVGFQNNNFMNTFYENKDFVDEFFKKSMRCWNRNLEYGYKEIAESIHYSDDSLVDYLCSSRPVYQITINGRCVCRFIINSTKIAVEYNPSTDEEYGSRVAIIDIPHPTDGINEDKVKWFSHANAVEMEKEFKYFFSNNPAEPWRYMITLMMLRFIGIGANYMGVHAIRKIGAISPVVGTSSVINFESCRDFVTL